MPLLMRRAGLAVKLPACPVPEAGGGAQTASVQGSGFGETSRTPTGKLPAS